MRGESLIRARFFHGTDDAAYFAGVQSNTAHGKPLSLAERLRAAGRILKTKPDLSDRMIAQVCGLSAGTVAKQRKNDPTGELTHHVGADRRRRPLSSTIAREQAAELILAFPDDSNRSIARSVGLSEGTVRDVRRRIERAGGTSPGRRDKPPRRDEYDLKEIMGTSETIPDDGVVFASWLLAHRISDTSWTGLLDDIPVAQRPQVISEALSISDSWRALAAQLEGRGRETSAYRA